MGQRRDVENYVHHVLLQQQEGLVLDYSLKHKAEEQGSLLSNERSTWDHRQSHSQTAWKLTVHGAS